MKINRFLHLNEHTQRNFLISSKTVWGKVVKHWAFSEFRVNIRGQVSSKSSWKYFSYLNINLVVNNIFNFNPSKKLYFVKTRKCPLRGHILPPPEGLRAPELPGVNPGSQGVIPRRFKGKIFCDARTDEGWTDRRDSRNSVVDGLNGSKCIQIIFANT